MRSKALPAMGLLALSMICAPAGAAPPPAFDVVTLVDSNHTRPDVNLPWYVYIAPALDGDHVVFMTKDAQVFATLDGIWTIDTTTMQPTKLAGLATPFPKGSGTFARFSDDGNTLPTAAGGYAVFSGYDQVGTFSLFSVPEAGGRIVNLVPGLMSPDGTVFADIEHVTTNGKTVAFYGRTSLHAGIYEVSIKGANLHDVIDGTTNLDARGYGGGAGYYGNYTSPELGKQQVSFYATGIGDPSTYPNEIFQTAASGYVGLADNLTPLAGDPAILGHTQITGFSAAVQNARVAFRAFDGAYSGIFLADGYIATAQRVVSTTSFVPGKADHYTSFGAFAYDATGLAFGGSDDSTGQSVYFVGPGAAPALVAPGNVYYAPYVGDRAVSNGRFVFFDGTIFGNAIYLATPAAH